MYGYGTVICMNKTVPKKRKRTKKSLQNKIPAFLDRLRYPKYLTTEKHVGETPLEATEKLRKTHNIPQHIPMAYAGRLDPMASGKLLILIGEECKKQKKYHNLDKEYRVELLFGVSSDSGDVLGLITGNFQAIIELEDVKKLFKKLEGSITLPYPHFSSKTIEGKPLHQWTLEKRLDEIKIPNKKSTIYRLTPHELRIIKKTEILNTVHKKIETIPKVTDPRKALGADFRRSNVRKSWKQFEANGFTSYQLLSFTCIASSGTYMRSLCEHMANELGNAGLAYSIHRTKIGKFKGSIGKKPIWSKTY